MGSEEWKERGEKGREHVSEGYEMDHVVDLHIERYEGVMGDQ